MKCFSVLELCAAVCLAAASQSAAQSAAVEGCLDPLIEWQNPWALTPAKFKQVVDPMGQGKAEAVYTVRADSRGGYAHYEFSLNKNPGFKFNVMGGRMPLQAFKCTFDRGELVHMSFHIGNSASPASPADVEALANEISKQMRNATAAPYDKTMGAPSDTREIGVEWVHPDYLVRLFQVSFLENGDYMPSGGHNVEFYLRGNDPPYRILSMAEREEARPKLRANLDALLNFATLWQWTPAELEKAYTAKAAEGGIPQGPPQFEWMNASKDRARFSRHMFADAETKLTMFGGSVKVEEAVLEFVNGKAARATVSFYNRGDSGEIKVADFDRVFKTVGQNLGQVTKVAPKRQVLSSNAALPVTGWMWSVPAAVALLEYNDYTKGGQPEFLRLKLASPSQADWSMGKLATGIQRMELLKRVTKKPDGDVFISGVPMVDQGNKGYCVAASCQRLFEYMRIPCDQHEMAKLVSVDAEQGADPRVMQKSLAKIDGSFNVTFKPLVNPELYYSGNGRRRVSEKEFLSLVKEYTDKGVPLLWALSLGRKPEEPPLPGAGQVSGGHMRLIIGYNAAKHQLLFTDSWGAGHELKRMAMLDAYDVTVGMFSMAPRGL